MTPRRFASRLKPFVVVLVAAAASEACTTPMPAESPAAPPTVRPVPPAPPLLQPQQASPLLTSAPPAVVPPEPTSAATIPVASLPTTKADVAPVLEGSVIHVVDGDTLKMRLSSGLITVRLASIDAPELDQPGGTEAMSALQRRLEGRYVELEVETQDQYERLVAFVYLGGENINSWLVQQGYAWAYRQYLSDPRYCVWEADARTSRRGLWGATPGSQRAPWEWRRAQREGGAFRFTDYQRETVSGCVRATRKSVDPRTNPGSAQQPQPVVSPVVVPGPATDVCRIKGNISESGRIYHVPGSESYERTRIDTRDGERWFCTEAEATAAGWRAPR